MARQLLRAQPKMAIQTCYCCFVTKGLTLFWTEVSNVEGLLSLQRKNVRLSWRDWWSSSRNWWGYSSSECTKIVPTWWTNQSLKMHMFTDKVGGLWWTKMFVTWKNGILDSAFAHVAIRLFQGGGELVGVRVERDVTTPTWKRWSWCVGS